jgi:hypothetical protein
LICLRRLVGCLAFYLIVIVCTYVAIELTHFVLAAPFEPPFSRRHFYTGFPAQLPALIISTFATQKIIDYSLNLIERYERYGSSLFTVGSHVLTPVVGGRVCPPTDRPWP